MSVTSWAFRVNAVPDRLIAWLSTFAARRGDTFGPAREVPRSREAIDMLIEPWGDGARVTTPTLCFPELLTALSRELRATVVTVAEQSNVGIQYFCVLEAGEINTLQTDLGDGVVEQEGFDRDDLVKRYLASGLVKIPPGGIDSDDVDDFAFSAFTHLARDVEMKHFDRLGLGDFPSDWEPSFRMVAPSLGARFVGYDSERGWRETMALVPREAR